MRKKYSIIYPEGVDNYKALNPVTLHDLGIDSIVKQLTTKEVEQNVILKVLSKMSANPLVSQYRIDVFEDIYTHKKMRDDMMDILGRINFLHDYGSFAREYDEGASVWDLFHRLDEIKDYIDCVEALFACLSSVELKSAGLRGLYAYVEEIYKDNGFEALKKDIEAIRVETSEIKSVTVGINLDSRFEANGIGIVSVNNKYYTKSGVISNFCEHIGSKDLLYEGDVNAPDKRPLKFRPFSETDSNSVGGFVEQMARTKMAMSNPLLATSGVVNMPELDQGREVTRYMDRIVNHMLSGTVKGLRATLNKYVSITITDMTDLIPEFMYYIRFAEYIENLMNQGYVFSKAAVCDTAGCEHREMHARGVYNIKLADLHKDMASEIVANDLDYDAKTKVYILTGANRGGKTTITQAIGQLFVLAQGGIYIPGEAFTFAPADAVYTHFPADEDQTMDLGRLGEECKRFRELYLEATEDSLLLLNETFSTTSFEEGYYIARDSVRAILKKAARTLYNTHMHKLAYDVEELTAEVSERGVEAKSLVVASDGGNRSYKVVVAPPEGKSYAEDIARKYGVTYEQLC